MAVSHVNIASCGSLEAAPELLCFSEDEWLAMAQSGL